MNTNLKYGERDYLSAITELKASDRLLQESMTRYSQNAPAADKSLDDAMARLRSQMQ